MLLFNKLFRVCLKFVYIFVRFKLGIFDCINKSILLTIKIWSI